MRPELENALDSIAEIVKPLVRALERNSTPITQNNYGAYMGLISTCTDRLGLPHTERSHLAIGIAITKAGANRAGVIAALRAMGHLS